MNRKRIFVIGLILCVAVCLAALNSNDLWPFGQNNNAAGPLVIKVEDFSIFLIESSEEIYRANVKDPAMWAGLREKAISDREYEQHYNWLFNTYNSWDEQRRSQLKTIMTTYTAREMAQSLIKGGKQEAGLSEVLKFMEEDGSFRNQRHLVTDFYEWYGTNYARLHYELLKPVLQRKVDVTLGAVGDNFDIIKYIEKETGIRQRKKPNNLELQLNMRIIGMSVYTRKKDTITTVQWNRPPEKIWTAVFNEFCGGHLNTFAESVSFRFLCRKLKKDDGLNGKYQDYLPYSWDVWIEKNLAEGFARYLVFRKGISKDLLESTYAFDREYAQALTNGFDPEKSSLKSFTSKFIKNNYNI